MRKASAFVTWSLLAAVAAACGGGDEPAPEEAAPAGETVMSVPDSTIEREIQTRLDADPRLDKEGIELRVTSQGGAVRLHGGVSSRRDWSIAREVAMSAPGVVSVDLDSVAVGADSENP